MEICPALRLDEVDKPVKAKLDEPEIHVSRHDPNCPGMDKGMGGQAMKPDASRALQSLKRVIRTMIFPQGKELALKRKICDRVGNEKGEPEYPEWLTATNKSLGQHHDERLTRKE